MNRRTTCNIPIKGWLGESNAITSALSSIGTLKNRIEALSATGTMNLVITRFTTGCVSPVPLAIIFVGAPEHTFAKHIAVASSRSTLAFGPLNTGDVRCYSPNPRQNDIPPHVEKRINSCIT